MITGGYGFIGYNFILNLIELYSDINIINVDNETYEYYIFNCKITNLKNTSQSKNMTVIINQEEGTNFTMSFSFN